MRCFVFTIICALIFLGGCGSKEFSLEGKWCGVYDRPGGQRDIVDDECFEFQGNTLSGYGREGDLTWKWIESTNEDEMLIEIKSPSRTTEIPITIISENEIRFNEHLVQRIE